MALARKEVQVVDAKGNVQAGASVTVRREVAGQPLEPLYSDRDGLVPIGNPVTADSNGVAAFHCLGGAFQIVATLGAFSRTQRYVPIGTAGEADVETIVALAGDVTGPASATDGQLAVFSGETGKVIAGATIGSPPAPVTLADFEPANAAILKADTSDDLEAGFTATSADQGTKSGGTFTPAFADRNIQHCVNGGAFTLGVPTGHGSLVLDITNDSSAGAITTSAYDLVTGDIFTTTDTHKFRCFITTGNAGSHLHVAAFQ